MKLFHSPSSPYVRKVMAVAIETGLADRIETVPTNPHESRPEYVAVNPLSKIPALIADDGLALFDSPVICEYLDSLHDGPRLYPAPGRARWVALRLHAMADGILDAAVLRRQEGMRARDADRAAAMDRLGAAVARTLDTLEADADTLEDPVTIGNLSAAVALGYLDFRFSGEPWREGRPRLAAWFEPFARRPSLARTMPAERG